MPTTQEVPHPPLEGIGFFQNGHSVDTVELPEGHNMPAGEHQVATGSESERKRATKRKEGQNVTELESGETEGANAIPGKKRVRCDDIDGTRVSESEAQPPEMGGGEGQNDITRHPDADGSCGEASGSGEAPPPGEDVKTSVKRITSETHLLLSKWKDTFCESEAFESFFPARVDELLKEAYALEENLKEKKRAMKNRLSAIASTLECFGNS